ncbi:hypothetical protein J2X34_003162 [Rhodococcus sp. BE178]
MTIAVSITLAACQRTMARENAPKHFVQVGAPSITNATYTNPAHVRQ